MNKLFKSNSWQYRLLRTIIQGVLAVVIAWVSAGTFDWHYLIVALIPAVLSPIMAELGKADEIDDDDDDWDE